MNKGGENVFAKLISPGSLGPISPCAKGCEDGYVPKAPCRVGYEPNYPRCSVGLAPPM